MKSTWTLAILAAAILIFLVYLSSNHKIPPVPHDDLHKNASTNASCLDCHAPGREAPLKAAHPPKEQCLICHKIL